MVKISDKGLISSNLVDWYVLGKFIINLKFLKTQSILIIKYASYAPIPWLRRMTIDENFKVFWIDLVEKQQINYDLLRQCSKNDIDLFEKIITKASLLHDLKYTKVESLEDQYVEKFNILRGEIMAHNNNSQIITEIKTVIDKLISYGRIKPEEKQEIIDDLENYLNENEN